jgi:hypothetical protein
MFLLCTVWQYKVQELVWEKNKGKLKTASFTFKVICTYWNAFVALKELKTVSKGLQRNSVQFGPHIFLNDISIPKSLHLRCSKRR